MKALVGVIAALVILGIAALGMLTMYSPRDDVARPAHSGQGAIARAAQPSAFMTPWPDLNDDLTTSVSTRVVSVASPSAGQKSSSPVVSERAAQTRLAATHHGSGVPAHHHSQTKKDTRKHTRTAATRAVQ
jgi:hypothetical protein